MKKTDTIFRTVLLALMMSLAYSLHAQNQFWVGGIHYEVTSSDYSAVGTVSVIAANDGYSGAITVPDVVAFEVTGNYGNRFIRHYKVTEIGENAFRDCAGLTSIVLPATVKTIGKNAFYGCSSLSSVTLSNGLNTIGASAFGYCTSLTSIILPNTVKTMEANAFYCCTALTDVTLSKNLTSLIGTFQGCTSLTTIDLPPYLQTLDGAFKDCSSLVNVNLPQGLKTIGANAFDGCSALRSIYLPDALEVISERAFAGTGLTKLELPATVATIDNDVFAGCVNLTSVSVRSANPPTMLNADGFAAETYASALLKVPELSLAAYQSADWWNLFQNITGDATLNNRYDFESGGIYYLITGPNTVEVTYKDNNYNSYSGTVNIPATVAHDGVTYNVTAIGNLAFSNCTSLTSVTIPSSVTSIGWKGFYGCTSLSAIEIPESVTIIGDAAFSNCRGLTALTIPVNVVAIGANAFDGISLQSLTWNARECWTNGNMSTYYLVEVNIGNEVTVLPDGFARLSKITSVDLPASLKYIGADALSNCSNLRELTVPANVIDVGQSAFRGLNLDMLTWNVRNCWTNGCSYYDYLNNYWYVKNLVFGDEVEVIPDYFAYRISISSLTIPASVKHIGSYAFNGCNSLTDIIIPDGVLTIGEQVFADCQNVNVVTIGKGVTSIGDAAFTRMNFNIYNWNARHCEYSGIDYGVGYNYLTIGDEVEVLPKGFASNSNITTLNIPPSVKTIGDGAFEYCHGLTDVVIPNSVTSMGYDVFSWSSVTSVTLSTSLTSIRDGSFRDCNELTEANIPEGVKYIGNSAFYECNSLTDLSLPTTLDTIDAYAFNRCVALRNLNIPASVTWIGTNAFKYCKGLESIAVEPANTVYDSRNNCNALLKTANDSIMLVCKNTVLPNTVTSIPDYAFYNNTELTHMDIPASVTYIGRSAFEGCTSLTDITIPAAVTTIGESAFNGCSSMSSMVVEQGNTVYDSREDCNAIIKTANNTLLFGCMNSTIPESVKCIGGSAFSGCTGLTDISLHDGLTSIGYRAFNGCTGLKNVTIPNSVTTLGAYAFSRCTGLTSVRLSNALKSISMAAFSYCSNLTTVTIPEGVTSIDGYAFESCTSLASVNIPNTVTVIGGSAFRNCRALTGIRIPDSVTTIGGYAFNGCTNLTVATLGSGLTTIYEDAFYNCNALMNVNSMATTPPTIAYWTFATSTCNNAVLRVPQNSVEAYQTANYWKRFANIVALEGCGPGDVNGDGRLSISDVTGLIDAILSGYAEALYGPYADVNGDGRVNITDVTTLINTLLVN